MTDPKHEEPESDHPHEDDLSLDLNQDQEGLPAAGDNLPLDDLSLSASTEEFHFSGPAEELDYTEPADFTFPGQPSGGEAASEHSGELAAAEPAEAEGLFGPEGIPSAESPPPEDAAVEPELAGEGIADLETAEEEKPKPKLELPAWVQTAQWVMVGLLAVGSLVAVICSIVWVPQNPKQVTLTLNICCPLMLALIPFALWRSSARWVTPATSAVYTVMLALSAAALIAGMWFQGLELSRYDWQFSRTRVSAGKPPRVMIPPRETAAEPPPPPVPAPQPEPAAPKDSAAPAAK